MSRGPSDSTDAARRQGLRRVPGDPGRPLVGHTFDFLRDQLGWARSRHARDTDVLGYFIPGGALVTVNSGLTQRLEEYWSNPAGFDPERFSPDRREDAGHKWAYTPFGGGVHRCIALG